MTDQEKRSNRRARTQDSAEPAPPAAPAVVAAPRNDRLFTVTQWARGRTDPITRAFVAEHERVRVVKRSASEWMQLYREFITQPRG